MNQPENIIFKTGYNRDSTPGDMMLRLSSDKLHESTGLPVVTSFPLVLVVKSKYSKLKKHFSFSSKMVFVIPLSIIDTQTCNVFVSRVFHQWHGDSRNYITNSLCSCNLTLHGPLLLTRSAFFNSTGLIDLKKCNLSQLSFSDTRKEVTAAYKYDKGAYYRINSKIFNVVQFRNTIQIRLSKVKEPIYTKFVYSENPELQTDIDNAKRTQIPISGTTFHSGTNNTKSSYAHSGLFPFLIYNKILNTTLESDPEKKLKIRLSLPGMAVWKKNNSGFRAERNLARSDVLIYSEGVLIQKNLTAQVSEKSGFRLDTVMTTGERSKKTVPNLNHSIQDKTNIKMMWLSGSRKIKNWKESSLHNMHYSHSNMVKQYRFIDAADVSGKITFGKIVFPKRRLSYLKIDTNLVSMHDVKVMTGRINRRSLKTEMNELQHVSKSVEPKGNGRMSEIASNAEPEGISKDTHENGFSFKKPLSISDTPVEFMAQNHIAVIADRVVHIIEERFHSEAKRKGLL